MKKNQKEYENKDMRGVKSVLENIHKWRKESQRKTDSLLILIDFQDAMNKTILSDRQKQVIDERFENGLTYKEVSKKLGISISTVQSYEDKAIEKIAINAKHIWEDWENEF